MRIAAVAFTRRGVRLARRLGVGLREQGDEFTLSCPDRYRLVEEDRALQALSAWCKEAFASADALLFVGACGIAVRGVARYVAHKFSDPAVVCVDESGTFAVPLLSGHVGGANALARRVAGLCGGTPVITTATDVNGIFAVDEWAVSQGLAILDREEAKEVSAALLRDEAVGFSTDFDVCGELPAGLVCGDEAASCAVGMSVSLNASRRPFARTLRLVPRAVVVGVGCKRGTPYEVLRARVDECLSKAQVAPEAVCALATIDLKADEEAVRRLVSDRGWELRLYAAGELAGVPGDFAASAFVRETVGVDNVCERAACAGGGRLLLHKDAAGGVTVALALELPALAFGARPSTAHAKARGGVGSLGGSAAVQEDGDLAGKQLRKVVCVGIGPGGGDDMTLKAHKTLLDAEVIVGYTTYVDLVRDSYPQAEFVTTGMRAEVARCHEALRLASVGKRVAVVCSGDPGVYGMAGLLMELVGEYPGVSVEVVPGVSAANGGAGLLGAPLMNDWCCISLSDLMTPWEEIEGRLRAAGRTGFCVCLYNPGSQGRGDCLARACDVLLEHLGEDTVCGIARNVGRLGETSEVLTLGELRGAEVDMRTCVFVGNAQTKVVAGRMVTPRGYDKRRERPAGLRGRQPRGM